MQRPVTLPGCRPRSRRPALRGRILAAVSSLPAPRSVSAPLILSVLALLLAAPLRAQDYDDPFPPTINPESGTFTSDSVLITVTFFDETSLNTNTRKIYLDEVEVTGLFTHTAPEPHPMFGGQQTSSSGTLTLDPGANVVRAEICDNGSNCTSADVTYTYLAGRPEVRVAPDGGVATASVGVAKAHTFRLVNGGTLAGTYVLRGECRDAWTGNRLSGCSVSTGSVTVAAGDSVALTVTAPGGSNGSTQLVRLVAELTSMPGVMDAGWLDVSVVGAGGTMPAPPALQRVDPYGPRIERAQCVTVAVAPGAAYECGDLRVAHPLPPHHTFNRAWNAALLYNSQHAHPMPTVYANVTVPANAPVPTSVQVVVTLADNTTRSATFPQSEFTPGVARRVAVQWDGLETVTGVYPYTVQATSHYTGQSIPSDTLQGRVVVVNRHESPFGAGWWLAGWERMQCIDCGTNDELLWVGGDGSTRIFTRTLPGVNRWTAPNPAGIVDSLTLSGGVYVRKLSGGGRTEIDAQGRHVRTVNRLGQTTHFSVNQTTGQLDSIRAPVPAGQTAPAWRFTYLVDHVTEVRATTPGASDRLVQFGYAGGWRPMNRIIDPDGVSTWFYYPSQMSPAEPYSARMRHMLDRRGTRHVFTYDGAWKLSSVRLWMGPTEAADDIIQGFEAGESRGVGTSVAVAQAYTLLDGPRTDVNDHTRLWLTSRGAPFRIRDAVGAETVLVAGDSRFPWLMNGVFSTNARGDSLVRRSGATFDSRGRVLTTTEYNPLGDGANVVTTYGWNSQWNRPSWIKAPGADTVRIEYSITNGNPLWQQQGSALRRVYFDYNAAGQVERIRYPHATTGVAGGGGRDSLAYDARGNLKRTVSPLGFTTLMYRDALGRVVETISPVHAASSSDSASVANTGMRSTVAYDVMDRDTLSVTYGRAMALNRVSGIATLHATNADTLTVRTTYDPGGLPREVERWATPDTAHVGVLSTSYTYDAAGRKTLEDDGTGLESYTYDAAGNVVVHTTRRSHQITMTYDALGRVTRRVTPPVTYLANNVDCSDPYIPGYPRWYPCVFSFPQFPNNGSGGWTIPADTAYFGFDAAGSMTLAQNGDAIVSRSYYPGGALRTDTLRIRAYGSGSFSEHAYGLEFRYDSAGRTRALLHPYNLAGAAQADSFAYEPVTGALQTVVGRTNLHFGYGYDLLGRLTSETMPTTSGTLGNTYIYDLDGRRTSRSGIYGETFTYDARGKVLSATIAGRSVFRNYYSGLGHLVATEWDNDNNAAEEVEEFRLDALGHQVWRRSATNNQLYRDPEYVTSYSQGTSRVNEVRFTYPAFFLDSTAFARDTTFRSYDAAGNVADGWERAWGNSYRKVYTRPYYGADDKLRAQQGYNEMGVEFKGERRGYFSEYRYDALGRRVLVRTRRDGLCFASTATASTVDCTSGIERYVWSGDNILWELRGPGAHSATAGQLEEESTTGQEYGIVGYTHAGGVDRPLVAYKTGGTNAGAVVVPHMNWRGLFSRATAPSGAASTVPVEWPGFRTTASHSMGETQAITKNWMGSLLEGQRDAGGLMYMRNRYYDPATGQFTQTDPIGIAGGLNTYGFAAGDPVSYDDPYGLKVSCKEGSQACLEWDIVKSDARRAMRSDDEAVRRAGRQLWGMIQEVERAEQTWHLRIGERSSLANRSDGGGVTWAARRVDSNGNPIVRTKIDVNYSPRKDGVPLSLVVAHEFGHAWALITGQQDVAQAGVDAENVYRTMLGCSQRAGEYSTIPRCRH